MNARSELWTTLHELAQQVSTKCSTRTKAAKLVQDLRDYPEVVQDYLLRDANLVVVALEELLQLAEESERSRRQATSD